MTEVGQVLVYTLAPFGATILGGVSAAFFAPGPVLRTSIQHFTAGVVFAAAASELLPDIVRRHRPIETAVGFALGLGLMLVVRWLGRRAERAGAGGGIPVGLLATIGVDVLIDGLLIGIGFAAGEEVGLLLTVALTAELLFLGLAAAVAFRASGGSPKRVLFLTAGFALLVPLGSTAGSIIAGAVSPETMELLLALGLVALLYLVTEELLVEAHEQPETPFTTAAFFVGFLLLLLARMLGQNP